MLKLKHMSIQSFLIGLIFVAYGVLTLKYNYRYANMFSSSAFIENWFGSMYLFFQITSVLAAILGLLFITGLADNLGNLITAPFRSSFGG